MQFEELRRSSGTPWCWEILFVGLAWLMLLIQRLCSLLWNSSCHAGVCRAVAQVVRRVALDTHIQSQVA